MKKLSEKWIHPSGISVKIWFKDGKKEIRLQTSNGKTEFVFNKSKRETIEKVGQALIDIANFIDFV